VVDDIWIAGILVIVIAGRVGAEIGVVAKGAASNLIVGFGVVDILGRTVVMAKSVTGIVVAGF
jgi:hypothetical protein